ncbi:MAG: methionyl-tRNA formyltransferase [Cytophagales bacterium]|nr:methionyl-tRNA formyltransferase [Cytophagales bacterium]MDW8384851.1 methionyl-tRNA formyltransferase [Flammeovirgaceae bacterium]
MRIVFMGTPEFAVPSLQILIENHYNVVAVVTATDKPSGRGKKVQESAVKKFAKQHQIPVLQPEKLKSPEFIEKLASYKADLQVVVAFRMLPEVVWKMPPLGTFNLHASLLPNYRGAAPINWAIINGETITGVTTFFVRHEIDTGDIILQESEPIFPDDDAGSLHDRLMVKGAQLVLKTVQMIQKGNVVTVPQSFSSDLKTAPKIFKETCQLDFQKEASYLVNFVRGLSPVPGAWTTFLGHHLKVFRAEVSYRTILEDFCTDKKTFLEFKTARHALRLLDVQLEGKRRMNIEEFLRGFRF